MFILKGRKVSKHIILSGASGFVGHHLLEHILNNTDWTVSTIDRLGDTTNKGFDRLREIGAFNNPRVNTLTYDLVNPIGAGLKKELGNPDYILHVAASSHVDNSIVKPVEFFKNNTESTLTMLEYARGVKGLKKFLYFSTDEVYGTAITGVNHKEGARFNPGNPYSASKAASECLCYAYSNTYRLPIVITNSMNIIGERQHPEKFVPLVINSIRNGSLVKIHADSTKQHPGTRFYIHARNVADGILYVLNETNETLDNIDASLGKFNIVGEVELDNLELAQKIHKNVNGNKLLYQLVDFHSTRPGHDLRYALDGTKMNDLGWKPPVDFDDSLEKTVKWTLDNKRWLEW